MRVIFMPDDLSPHYGAWVEDERTLHDLVDGRYVHLQYKGKPEPHHIPCILGYPLAVASKSLWDRLLLLALCERAEVWQRETV